MLVNNLLVGGVFVIWQVQICAQFCDRTTAQFLSQHAAVFDMRARRTALSSQMQHIHWIQHIYQIHCSLHIQRGYRL